MSQAEQTPDAIAASTTTNTQAAQLVNLDKSHEGATILTNIHAQDNHYLATTSSPIIPIIEGGGTICANEEPLTLKVKNYDENLEFVWYHGHTAVGIGPTYEAQKSGVYFVRSKYKDTWSKSSNHERVKVRPKLQPDAGTDQHLCGSQTIVTGKTNRGRGVWSTSSKLAKIHPFTGKVTNMEGGKCHTFIWTVSDGDCTESDEVVVCVKAFPSKANAGADQHITATTTVLLATFPKIGEGHWSLVGGTDYPNPFILFDKTNQRSVVSGLKHGHSYEFRWKVANGMCAASDTVIINVYEKEDFDELSHEEFNMKKTYF